MVSAPVIKFVWYLLHNSKGAFFVGGIKVMSSARDWPKTATSSCQSPFKKAMLSLRKNLPKELDWFCRLPSPTIASWHPKHFSLPQFFSTLNWGKKKKPCCQQRQFSYMISYKMFIQVNRNSTALIKSLTCPRQSLLLLSVPWSAWNAKEINLVIHALWQIYSK